MYSRDTTRRMGKKAWDSLAKNLKNTEPLTQLH